jgi:short-subunit dehydrogenase
MQQRLRITRVTTIFIHWHLIISSFRRGVSCESQFGTFGVRTRSQTRNHWAHRTQTLLSHAAHRSLRHNGGHDVTVETRDDADDYDDYYYDDGMYLHEINDPSAKEIPTISFSRRGNMFRSQHEKTCISESSQSSTMMVSLDQQIQQSQNTVNNVSAAVNDSLWPPWPFNLLKKQKSQSLSPSRILPDGDTSSFFTFLRQRALGGLQQMQTMGNAVSFHLPPAATPLFLLAILPTRLKAMEVVEAAADAAAASTNKIPTHLPNKVAKTLSLISLGTAVVCWADYEVRKKKRLTPLPLSFSSTNRHRDIQTVILPPFLPPPLPPIELDPVLGSMNNVDEKSNMDQVTAMANDGTLQDLLDTDGYFDMNIPKLKRSIDKILPKPERFSLTIRSWQKMMRVRQRDDLELKRRKIMDRLLVLQELKKQEREKQSLLQKSRNLITAHGLGLNTHYGSVTSSGSDNNVTATRTHHVSGIGQRESPLGYAVVTGASRGIGRAIAVELARWDVPLILVARDKEKLIALANEIKTAYGVDCCVIPTDLSKEDAAQKIHQATTNARLKVDILINNAGVYSVGDVVDGSAQDLMNMINVNVATVTNLSYLYGKDMKRHRRGRILFVSSLVGATPGGAGVAGYAATKAYEKTLSQSMGREMEKYGVGVTCIMPGATKGTSFSSTSGDLACYKYPFYAMSSQSVAESGIRALLSGDAEVIPGWHNRLFLKLLTPLIPQRLTSSVVGFSFGPFKIEMPTMPWKWSESGVPIDDTMYLDKSSLKKPPLVLKIPDDEKSLHNPLLSLPKNMQGTDEITDKDGEKGMSDMELGLNESESGASDQTLNDIDNGGNTAVNNEAVLGGSYEDE